MANATILFAVVAICLFSILYTILWMPTVMKALGNSIYPIYVGLGIALAIFANEFFPKTSFSFRMLLYFCIFIISCLLAALVHFITSWYYRKK